MCPFRPAVLFLAAALPTLACTSAVIGAKASADGRPLLWKNRDNPSDPHNQVVQVTGGRFAFVGTTGGRDPGGLRILSGLNTAGFAIVDADAENLENRPDDGGFEGLFMRMALQTCATVEDFQAFLASTDGGGRRLATNFGVIDARGGAACFEAGERGFRRYDADQAPSGILVRTNFAVSGRSGEGGGYLRAARATRLLEELGKRKALNAATLLAEVARDTANERLGSFPEATRRGFFFIGDSLSRSSGTNVFVAEGVRPGEDPLGATAWILLGQALTGVAVPVWAGVAAVPEVLRGPVRAPLHAAFERVRAWLKAPGEEGARYLDAGRAYDPAGGIRPGLAALEKANLEAVRRGLAAGRSREELEKEVAGGTIQAVQALLRARGIP